MCSILAIFEISGDAKQLRRRALQLSRRQRHRGPDWSGVHADERAILVHERLSIVDVEHGAQPLVSPDGKQVLAVNGEIYNHRQLSDGLAEPYEFATASDCEVILPLYRQRGTDFLNDMNGIFAFALWDAEQGRYFIARDPIGVMPLYIGYDAEGRFYVASEMKALIDTCTSIREFPPGHYLDSAEGSPVRYYEPGWRDYDKVRGVGYDGEALRDAMVHAVERQLMCDVPYGVLLSGGLDSSVIAASAHEVLPATGGGRRAQTEAWWPQLHSFAIGLEGSPDLAGGAGPPPTPSAPMHHEFQFTVQEGLDALSDVIHHIETYDVTTVRASTPMYLMARRIKAMGIKMVLTGEGADEIFGGYLYFHKAPDAARVPRGDRAQARPAPPVRLPARQQVAGRLGHRGRVPFLDREFLDVAMGFDASGTRCADGKIEKHVLRAAFEGFLPDEILWRQKEQFSDGVGYSWIDSLRRSTPTTRCPTRYIAPRAATASLHNTPGDEGSLLLPHAVRLTTSPANPAAACVPARHEHRLQHADGDPVGPDVPGSRGSFGAGGGGRPQGRLLAHSIQQSASPRSPSIASFSRRPGLADSSRMILIRSARPASRGTTWASSLGAVSKKSSLKIASPSSG